MHLLYYVRTISLPFFLAGRGLENTSPEGKGKKKEKNNNNKTKQVIMYSRKILGS